MTRRSARLIGLAVLTHGAVAALAIVARPASLANAQDAQPESLGGSFVDFFTTIDEQRWFISDGWTNGGHQSCRWRRKNVAIADGQLVFSLSQADDYARQVAVRDAAQAAEAERQAKAAAAALKNPGSPAAVAAPADTVAAAADPNERLHDCAEIRTRDYLHYGTYEVAMRPSSLSGTNSSMFTYVGPGLDPKKPHDEIDFEFLGKDTSQVQLNFYQDGKSKNESLAPIGFDASKTYTRLAFQWLPDKIRWYIDGKFVRETLATPEKPLPSEPALFYLSFWSGEGPDMAGWLGPFDGPGTTATTTSYDYIAYTKLGEPCQFAASIVCQLERGDSGGVPNPAKAETR